MFGVFRVWEWKGREGTEDNGVEETTIDREGTGKTKGDGRGVREEGGGRGGRGGRGRRGWMGGSSGK